MEKNGKKILKPGDEVSFKYEYAEQFKTIYANGVWGGPNAYGDIVMNLFVEKAKPPEESKHAIREDGTLEEKSRVPSKDIIVRELQVGIFLNLNVARSIKNWLDQKIKVMESSIAEKKGGNGK